VCVVLDTEGTPSPQSHVAVCCKPCRTPARDSCYAEEKARLEDFFARKRADPAAQWDAAPTTVDADENPFSGWVTGQPIP